TLVVSLEGFCSTIELHPLILEKMPFIDLYWQSFQHLPMLEFQHGAHVLLVCAFDLVNTRRPSRAILSAGYRLNCIRNNCAR
ncbi:MAG: hypothetical protein AABY88_06190, partial [Pseudomonadota bacterium]